VGHVLLQAVLECDVERHELLAEEKQLMALLNKVWANWAQRAACAACADVQIENASLTSLTDVCLCIMRCVPELSRMR
jgi:hypothetical protein